MINVERNVLQTPDFWAGEIVSMSGLGGLVTSFSHFPKFSHTHGEKSRFRVKFLIPDRI